MRYYYTDPIAAAFMNREYGVEIGGKLISWRSWESIFKDKDGFYDLIKEKIYVHPDSEHIFEPQDGDKDEDGYVYHEKLKWWLWSGSDQTKKHVFNKGFHSKTARRNNKQFFMPETETTN